MEADFEIQVGGDAPVIEALWEGFVDLRRSPERIAEISEAVGFPALAQALLALNGAGSTLWTAKCDVWDPHALGLDESVPGHSVPSEPRHAALACYIDLLPLSFRVFATWKDAENFCRRWVSQLDMPETCEDASGATLNATVDLIVRQALAGAVEGFGITAYLGGVADYRTSADEALAAALELFVAACLAIPTS